MNIYLLCLIILIPDAIEGLSPIVIQKGIHNTYYDLKIRHNGIALISETPYNKMGVIWKTVFNTLKIFPTSLLLKFKSLVEKTLSKTKRFPQKRFSFAKHYYDELSIEKFEGITFMVPSSTTEYLEGIYGAEWATPQNTTNKYWTK